MKKQSSSRLSSLAARIMANLTEEGAMHKVYPAGAKLHSIDRATGLDWGDASLPICTVRELRALCASVLSQDETKGQRPAKKKKAKKK